MIKQSTLKLKGINNRPRWVNLPANKLYISEDLHGWIPRFSDFKHSKNRKKIVIKFNFIIWFKKFLTNLFSPLWK